METIDCTPTWQEAMNTWKYVMNAVISGSHENPQQAQKDFWIEVQRIAKQADKYNKTLKLLNTRQFAEKYNSEYRYIVFRGDTPISGWEYLTDAIENGVIEGAWNMSFQDLDDEEDDLMSDAGGLTDLRDINKIIESVMNMLAAQQKIISMDLVTIRMVF